MGYTHYFKLKRDFTHAEWHGIQIACKKIFDQAEADSVKVGEDYYDQATSETRLVGPPKSTFDYILFNGDPAHETFCLERTREASSENPFCKTNRKPYDAVVVSILAWLKQHHSDAFEYIESDGENDVFDNPDYTAEPPLSPPMMEQWHDLRGQLDPDVVLLFRLGDFYELFKWDAERCAPRLDITVTKRNGIPMAGIPYHVKDQYFSKLLADGLSLAIVEQKEGVGRELMEIKRPGESSAPKKDPSLTRKQRIDAALAGLKWLKPYVPEFQRKILAAYLRTSEEWEYFADLIPDLVHRFITAPRTYDQKNERDPVAYFHYFRGGYDAWVTELDAGDPEEPHDKTQHQVRAFCRFDHAPDSAEMGYVHFPELFESQVELDFQWQPKRLSEVRAKLARSA